MENNKFQPDENIEDMFNKHNSEAEEMLEDEDKMERFLQRLEKKLKTIPMAGSSLAYVPMMISMVRMFIMKEYTDTPVTSIVSIVTTLIYVLSPIDLVPDAIPGIGYVDDAFVVSACLALVRTDLEDYRSWREKNGMEIDDIPDYEDIAKEATKANEFGKAFLRGKESAQRDNK